MKEKFCSSKLTKDDLWILEVGMIPQNLRDEEAELMQTRWFDYRDLLPSQATYLFAEFYETVYKEWFSKARDYREAEKTNPLLVPNIFDGIELLSFWKARQSADRIGCKYDFYIRFVMSRFHERGWGYLPRPNQIYGEELVLDIADSWKESLGCTLQVATKPRFCADAYEGHPDQIAYHEFLIEQIKKREHQHMLLARLVFKERVLPLELAAEHFSAGVLNRAQFF